MIVAVTGGRNYTRVDRVFRALDFIHARESYGKAGGPIRNSHMLRNEGARYVVWFPGGSGTASAKQCAVTQSILLIEGETL